MNCIVGELTLVFQNVNFMRKAVEWRQAAEFPGGLKYRSGNYPKMNNYRVIPNKRTFHLDTFYA
tara:strand:+ start:1598 stop:1789 length:192 start_codon:yes stop_codon:yes gene_type:complete